MKDYLVNFIRGTTLMPNGENLIFNRTNVPIPKIGEKIQFPRKYWTQTGSNSYKVVEVIYQYQDEDESCTFVWVLCDLHHQVL